jgi:hypothetical protein
MMRSWRKERVRRLTVVKSQNLGRCLAVVFICLVSSAYVMAQIDPALDGVPSGGNQKRGDEAPNSGV